MSHTELVKIIACLLPIVRLSEGRYLVGAEVKKLIKKTDRVLVQTGGGFSQLYEHLCAYAMREAIVIWKAMMKHNISYSQAIQGLLIQAKAKNETVRSFNDGLTTEIDDLFEVLITIFKEQRKLNKA